MTPRGKRVIVFPTAPRCGYVVVSKWNPVPGPVTLNIPGRGLLEVVDPANFALGAVMKLECLLTGQPETEGGWWNGWTAELLLDALRAVGCEGEIESMEVTLQ